jgi:archaellum component FlaC
MSSEPDNLVLAHLRELRAEMSAVEQRTNKRFDALEQHMDKMDGAFAKVFRSFVGHRSMVERTVADHEEDISDLKVRVRRLEEAQA